MRCPEPFPCTCTIAADVAAQIPRGSLHGISSAKTRPRPPPLRGVDLSDGRGKSSLLWIVIIRLVTSPASTPSQISVSSWLSHSDMLFVAAIIDSTLKYQLFSPTVDIANLHVMVFFMMTMTFKL